MHIKLSPLEALRARIAEKKQGGGVKAPSPAPALSPKLLVENKTKNKRRRELIEIHATPRPKSRVPPELAKMRHKLSRKKEGLPEVMEGEALCCYCGKVELKKYMVNMGKETFRHNDCRKPAIVEPGEVKKVVMFHPCPVPDMVIECKQLKAKIEAEMCPVFSGAVVKKGCPKCPVEKAGKAHPDKLEAAVKAKAKYENGFKIGDFIAYLRSVHSLLQGG